MTNYSRVFLNLLSSNRNTKKEWGKYVEWNNNIDNQLGTTVMVYNSFQSAQHVTGDDFASHQEH